MTTGTRTTRGWPSRAAASVAALVASCVWLLCVAPASAQVNPRGQKTQGEIGVDVVERLGERIPQRLEFIDSYGETAPLAAYFDGEKPVIMVLGYFGCPIVCPAVFDHLTDGFIDLDYTVGEDFRVVVVSFDPSEGLTEASAERDRQIADYGRGSIASMRGSWAFLTSPDPEAAKALGEGLGISYKRLPNGEYSHPVVVSVLSPQGAVTRYFYGFDYPADQLKLSLLDASAGKIAKSIGDRILHFCYRYDPTAGAYSVEAMALMRAGGVLTVIGLIVLIWMLFASERVRRGVRAVRLKRQNTGPRAEPRVIA